MYGKHHTNEWRSNHSNLMRGQGNPNFGKKWCWINKNNITKRIEQHQLDLFISDGWYRGRKSPRPNSSLPL
jgi:hypothetical protein